MSKYRRITYEDRSQIYALSKRGASQENTNGCSADRVRYRVAHGV